MPIGRLFLPRFGDPNSIVVAPAAIGAAKGTSVAPNRSAAGPAVGAARQGRRAGGRGGSGGDRGSRTRPRRPGCC